MMHIGFCEAHARVTQLSEPPFCYAQFKIEEYVNAGTETRPSGPVNTGAGTGVDVHWTVWRPWPISAA